MGEVGILTEQDRVELLDGEVVKLSPIGSRHARCVNRLNHALVPAVTGRAIVSVQNPVLILPRSEPQPDLLVLAWRDDFYPDHPRPADVLLLIEVADTSIGFDRDRKMPLYGRAGVPESWLVDLPSGLIEVHTRPGPDGYGVLRRVRPGDQLAPVALPDVSLDVAAILA